MRTSHLTGSIVNRERKLLLYLSWLLGWKKNVGSTSCSGTRTGYLADRKQNRKHELSLDLNWSLGGYQKDRYKLFFGCELAAWPIAETNWQAQAVLGCELATWPLTETNCIWKWIEFDWHNCRSLNSTGMLTRLLNLEIDMTVDIYCWQKKFKLDKIDSDLN